MSYRRKHINPKIRILKNKKNFFKNPILWIFLGFLMIIVILYFLLFFPGFQIERINMSGNEKVTSRDIENITWSDINRKIFTIGNFQILTKSIFIVDTENLIKDILNKFPDIENVELQKKIPHDIILKIKERKPYAALCQSSLTNISDGQTNENNPDKCFLLDENGIIFEKLENIPQDMIIMHQEAGSKEVAIGENIVKKNIVDIIFKVKKSLKNNFQINIKEVFISNPLIFQTNENWQIYFDTNSDIDMQITKMNVLLRDEIPVNARKNLQYIYLQYKDRAYYK